MWYGYAGVRLPILSIQTVVTEFSYKGFPVLCRRLESMTFKFSHSSKLNSSVSDRYPNIKDYSH